MELVQKFSGGEEGSDEVSHGQIFSWIRACAMHLSVDPCAFYPESLAVVVMNWIAIVGGMIFRDISGITQC